MTTPVLPATWQFADEEKAREHLCDHVLTRPEAHDWSLILPGYSARVRPDDDVRLTAVASSLFSPAPAAEGVELLRGYLTGLQQAIEDAVRLGWWWEHREGKYAEWHGLGLAGVFVIWDGRVVKTGFLPRSAEYPPAGPPTHRLKNPLPRRRLDRRMPAVPADTAEERYRLFHDNLLRVARFYENAYHDNAVEACPSTVFVARPPRIGKWTQLLADRPAPPPARSEEPPP